MPYRDLPFDAPPSEAEMNNAEFITLGIACDLDKIILSKPELAREMAVIYANSAIAAAQLLLSRHGVTEEKQQALYDVFWADMVERNKEH